MSRHKCNIGWGFLPLLFAATAILTFLVCYLIAVSLDHVIPFVPYISDTGAYPPESCLFSQFLNVAAALGILAVYIRWKSLKKLSVENVKRFSCLNTSSFVIGVLAAIGLSVVGNFQWTSQFEIHIIGAGMAFGLGLVYCWMQSHLTYKLHPRYNSLWIARLRVILALMVTLSLISMWVSQTIFILFLSKGLLPAWAYSGNFISQSTIDWLQLPISITHNATLNDTSTESKVCCSCYFHSCFFHFHLALQTSPLHHCIIDS
ncbi:DNA damage-regulated autophagy modulator protein 2-like isoform X2 [Ptychodera flava]|uniref:DNA damage-regulated autophagy modulator protein 2-like isoform X2 n=1 Tax=Ptychodera flava TaxID=63121 RepID=UPI003969FD01